MNVSEAAESSISGNDQTDVSSGAAARGKRNLTLAMLVLTAGTGAVALIARHGPQSAAAAPTIQADPGYREIIPADISGSHSSAVSPKDLVAKFHFAPADVQVPLKDLKADPFESSVNSAQPVELPEDPTEIQRREQERKTALDGVKSLHLESIQRDDAHRICSINGTPYEEGQEIDGFVIEEIATTTVVVRKSVYRFELRVR